jgi:hypothetical protein
VSADNWAVCPRCDQRHEAEVEAKFKAVDDAYGKVPMAEFTEMTAAARAFSQTKVDPTFREDYEFYGAEDGVVVAAYRGQCTVCALSLTFKHEHPIEGL